MVLGRPDCSDSRRIGWAPLPYFVMGVFEFVGLVTLYAILKRSRHLASRGDKGASKLLVLPIYHLVVYYILVVGTVVCVINTIGIYPGSIYVVGIKWFLNRTSSEALALFLLHNGVGNKAITNSIFGGFSWGAISTVVPFVLFAAFGEAAFVISLLCFASALFLFYVACWLLPPKYFHRRPAMSHYARFYVVAIGIFIAVLIILVSDSFDSRSCGLEGILAFLDLVQPFIVFRALMEDSKFWQGLYTHSTTNLNQPLVGAWDMGRDTIGMVADSISALEKKVVNIIPFGVLTVDASKYFSGGTARVYKGCFRNEEVAIKILFCMELTPESVVDFCTEASLLHSLQHANVVKCFGVAVMPPAMSLVTEFCDHGSLYDFLHATDLVFGSGRGSLGITLARRPNKRYGTSRTSGEVMNPVLTQGGDEEQGLSAHSTSYLSSSHHGERLSTKGDNIESLVGNTGSGHVPSAFRSSLSLSNRLNHSEDSSSVIPPPPPRLPERLLKSAASMMQSAHMGFGMGTAASPAVKLDSKKRLNQSELSGGSGRSGSSGGRGGSGRSTEVNSRLSMKGFLASEKTTTARKSIGGVGCPQDQDCYVPLPDRSFDKGRASDSSGQRQTFTSLKKFLPMSLRLQFALDCCSGLAYLHSKGLMHCDVKSLNFLVTKDLVIKLADLGEARPSTLDESLEVDLLPRNLNWSSPEILNNNASVINEKADIWSLALVVTEILTGIVPFDTSYCRGLALADFIEELKKGLRPEFPADADESSPWLVDMLNQAWEYEPSQRCSGVHMVSILEQYTDPPHITPAELSSGGAESVSSSNSYE